MGHGLVSLAMLGLTCHLPDLSRQTGFPPHTSRHGPGQERYEDRRIWGRYIVSS
jgi:hypothetical protein